jgi:hypothetical protein
MSRWRFLNGDLQVADVSNRPNSRLSLLGVGVHASIATNDVGCQRVRPLPGLPMFFFGIFQLFSLYIS